MTRSEQAKLIKEFRCRKCFGHLTAFFHPEISVKCLKCNNEYSFVHESQVEKLKMDSWIELQEVLENYPEFREKRSAEDSLKDLGW